MENQTSKTNSACDNKIGGNNHPNNHLSTKKRKREIEEIELKVVPIEERVSFVAKKSIESKEKKIGQCPDCWFAIQKCICAQFQKTNLSVNVRLIVWMHPKEFRRSSNTGKLIVLSCPNNSKMILFGKDEDDKYLLDLIDKEYDSTYFLYPESNSVSSQQLISQFFETKNNNNPITSAESKQESQSNVNNNPNQNPINLILIDGTWSNVKKPSSNFDFLFFLLFHSNQKQTKRPRVCLFK